MRHRLRGSTGMCDEWNSVISEIRNRLAKVSGNYVSILDLGIESIMV